MTASADLQPPAPPTCLPPTLVQAYRSAWYEVTLHRHGQLQLCTLQVDVVHPGMQQAMQEAGAACACLLTACNPLGQVLSPYDNEVRMRQCKAALVQAGWTFAPACGRDPLGLWPGEDSLLVWHMGRAQARQWGTQWTQNAVLWMDASAQPQLLLLR